MSKPKNRSDLVRFLTPCGSSCEPSLSAAKLYSRRGVSDLIWFASAIILCLISDTSFDALSSFQSTLVLLLLLAGPNPTLNFVN